MAEVTPNSDLRDESDNIGNAQIVQTPAAWKSRNTLREKDVGIELTVGKCPKIHAVFKERYADFHVHEIDPDGNIVHLTSFDLPESGIDSKEVQIALDDPTLSQCINEDVLKNLQALQNADDKDSKSKRVEFIVSNMDKETRTKLHRWIGKFDKLSSQTVDKDGDKYISVQHRTKETSKFQRRPANRARYTHCVLYKAGLDTSDAIGFLSRKLRLNPNLITYAGTKDKRAKTTQRLCISNIDAKRLTELNRISNQSQLGNFTYLPTRIGLGDLKGNHFRILLKDIKADTSSDVPLETRIDDAVASLKTNGFINYFGLQRFGSYSISTHVIGKALLQMKWETVFDLILEAKSNDVDFMRKAKSIWFETRDPVQARKMIPEWSRSIESNLIHGLAKYYQRKDFLSVLNCIPRNMRTLYLHAFQSYIWNRLATHRIEKYGMKPIVGDLVYADAQPNSSWTDDPVDTNLEDVTLDNSSPECGNVPQHQPRPKIEVKTLTTEELDKYTIFDVLLPLDGTDIQYPSNGIKEYATKLLEESELTPDYLKAYKHRSDTPVGAYRKILIQPMHVSHKIVGYNENDSLDALIPSDLDILLQNGSTDAVVPPPTEDRPHNRKCLQLEFSLPSSSYATMALRELLSTSDRDFTEPSTEVNLASTDDEDLPNVEADGVVCKKPKLDN